MLGSCVFALITAVIFPLAIAATKAGTSCSKLNSTSVVSGYKYTCIKSGKKLVWSTGIKVNVSNPVTMPTLNSSPTPMPTQNNVNLADLKYQNQKCDEVGAGLKDGNVFYRCYLVASGKLVWRLQSGPELTGNENYSGKSCDKSFDTLNIKDTVYRCLTEGTVELRWDYLDLLKYDQRTGEVCSANGEKITVKNGYLLCDPVYGATKIWKYFELGPQPTKNASKYKGIASSGSICDLSGDTYDVSGGYLECRYVNGEKLQWIKINSTAEKVSNPVSPNGVETCRLKNKDVSIQSWRMPGTEAGFPVVSRNMMNNPGDNKLLIVGMDFAEHPGDSTLKNKLSYDSKYISDWFDFYSNGKVKFTIDSIDHWVRSSKPAKEYIDQQPDRLAFSQADINKNVEVNGQPIIDEISKVVDLRKYSTVFVFFPKGTTDFTANLILRNAKFKIKEGEKLLNFFSWNADLESLKEQGWWFLIHEVLHDFPLPLHAPGNGWLNERYTFGLNSWSRFQMNWLNDNQIYCVEKQNLKPVEISLSPVEREDSFTKMVTIKLSLTKAIVIQAHGVDKWSAIESAPWKFPPGFYGIVAYLVNLEDAGAFNFGTDGRATTNDDGNDPKYPKWAYYMPIEGSRSFPKAFFPEQTLHEYTKYIAGQGDSFVIDGVKIDFVKSSNYETVRVSLKN